MKKRFFRSLESLLENKKVVLPFIGLLAASAILVWTTAFVPGKKETGEDTSTGKNAPDEGENPPEPVKEMRTSGTVTRAGAGPRAEHLQCKAITKKGTRCQHMADESGYCRQHRALFEQVPLETNPNL